MLALIRLRRGSSTYKKTRMLKSQWLNLLDPLRISALIQGSWTAGPYACINLPCIGGYSLSQMTIGLPSPGDGLTSRWTRSLGSYSSTRLKTCQYGAIMAWTSSNSPREGYLTGICGLKRCELYGWKAGVDVLLGEGYFVKSVWLNGDALGVEHSVKSTTLNGELHGVGIPIESTSRRGDTTGEEYLVGLPLGDGDTPCIEYLVCCFWLDRGIFLVGYPFDVFGLAKSWS